MRGAIVINGYYLGESGAHQLGRMTEALAARGAQTDVFRGNELLAWLDGSAESALGKRDFVLFLDKDIHLSYALERAGYRLYNSARSIELCDDKMRTLIALAGELPVPRTVSSPLMYRVKEDDFAARVERHLGLPVVVKKNFGSMGYGVRLARTREELREIREEWKLEPHLYQEYLAESAGRDIRVIVVGGRALGAMERVNAGDFRSNVEQGGVGRAIALSPRMREIAERAAELLGLCYAGVDLLETDAGPVLCEVNSNAYFRAFEESTGVPVGDVYADFVVFSSKNDR